MTISAIVGGRDWTDFATNSGYGEFVDWTEGLDEDEYEPVIHLADWGWWEGLEELETSLKSAVSESPPPEPVGKSIDHLLDALGNRQEDDVTVLITNGTGP